MSDADDIECQDIADQLQSAEFDASQALDAHRTHFQKAEQLQSVANAAQLTATSIVQQHKTRAQSYLELRATLKGGHHCNWDLSRRSPSVCIHASIHA